MTNGLYTSRSSDTSNAYEDRIYSNDGFPELIRMIDTNTAGDILDVGCGAGGNARLIQLRCPNARLVGITLSHKEADVARQHFHQLYVCDVQTCSFESFQSRFDAVILSHVLEHLVDPAGVLRRLRGWLKPTGRVYVALPNIAFYQQRFRFLWGGFEYTETGLMDSTHLHFYTWNTARGLIERCGFAIDRHIAIGSVPLRPLRKAAPSLSARADRAFTNAFPNLFGLHTIIQARVESTFEMTPAQS